MQNLITTQPSTTQLFYDQGFCEFVGRIGSSIIYWENGECIKKESSRLQNIKENFISQLALSPDRNFIVALLMDSTFFVGSLNEEGSTVEYPGHAKRGSSEKIQVLGIHWIGHGDECTRRLIGTSETEQNRLFALLVVTNQGLEAYEVMKKGKTVQVTLTQSCQTQIHWYCSYTNPDLFITYGDNDLIQSKDIHSNSISVNVFFVPSPVIAHFIAFREQITDGTNTKLLPQYNKLPSETINQALIRLFNEQLVENIQESKMIQKSLSNSPLKSIKLIPSKKVGKIMIIMIGEIEIKTLKNKHDIIQFKICDTKQEVKKIEDLIVIKNDKDKHKVDQQLQDTNYIEEQKESNPIDPTEKQTENSQINIEFIKYSPPEPESISLQYTSSSSQQSQSPFKQQQNQTLFSNSSSSSSSDTPRTSAATSILNEFYESLNKLSPITQSQQQNQPTSPTSNQIQSSLINHEEEHIEISQSLQIIVLYGKPYLIQIISNYYYNNQQPDDKIQSFNPIIILYSIPQCEFPHQPLPQGILPTPLFQTLKLHSQLFGKKQGKQLEKKINQIGFEFNSILNSNQSDLNETNQNQLLGSNSHQSLQQQLLESNLSINEPYYINQTPSPSYPIDSSSLLTIQYALDQPSQTQFCIITDVEGQPSNKYIIIVIDNVILLVSSEGICYPIDIRSLINLNENYFEQKDFNMKQILRNIGIDHIYKSSFSSFHLNTQDTNFKEIGKFPFQSNTNNKNDYLLINDRFLLTRSGIFFHHNPQISSDSSSLINQCHISYQQSQQLQPLKSTSFYQIHFNPLFYTNLIKDPSITQNKIIDNKISPIILNAQKLYFQQSQIEYTKYLLNQLFFLLNRSNGRKCIISFIRNALELQEKNSDKQVNQLQSLLQLSFEQHPTTIHSQHQLTPTFAFTLSRAIIDWHEYILSFINNLRNEQEISDFDVFIKHEQDKEIKEDEEGNGLEDRLKNRWIINESHFVTFIDLQELLINIWNDAVSLIDQFEYKTSNETKNQSKNSIYQQISIPYISLNPHKTPLHSFHQKHELIPLLFNYQMFVMHICAGTKEKSDLIEYSLPLAEIILTLLIKMKRQKTASQLIKKQILNCSDLIDELLGNEIQIENSNAISFEQKQKSWNMKDEQIKIIAQNKTRQLWKFGWKIGFQWQNEEQML